MKRSIEEMSSEEFMKAFDEREAQDNKFMDWVLKFLITGVGVVILIMIYKLVTQWIE